MKIENLLLFQILVIRLISRYFKKYVLKECNSIITQGNCFS